MDLALNNLQRLICHKTKQTKPNQTYASSSFWMGETLPYWNNHRESCNNRVEEHTKIILPAVQRSWQARMGKFIRLKENYFDREIM